MLLTRGVAWVKDLVCYLKGGSGIVGVCMVSGE